jgi:hypothetical protein
LLAPPSVAVPRANGRMQEGMSVDCCGRCSLGDGILLSPIPHKVDLKVTMGVVAVDSLTPLFMRRVAHSCSKLDGFHRS